ncbi:MAG: hypothetical protein MJ204_04210 [Bacteroidales bacterium]|nr:hypothetical protein [Bacteroidales bacterium]
MLQLFLIVLFIVALCFIGLAVNILFFNKPFPDTEVGHNKEMRKRGIKCAKGEELRIYRSQQRKKRVFQSATLDVERLQQSDER